MSTISLSKLKAVESSETSISLDSTFRGKRLYCTADTAITITVTSTELFSVFAVTRKGDGDFTLAEGSNVNLEGTLSSEEEGQTVVLHAYKKSGSDTVYHCD